MSQTIWDVEIQYSKQVSLVHIKCLTILGRPSLRCLQDSILWQF